MWTQVWPFLLRAGDSPALWATDAGMLVPHTDVGRLLKCTLVVPTVLVVVKDGTALIGFDGLSPVRFLGRHHCALVKAIANYLRRGRDRTDRSLFGHADDERPMSGVGGRMRHSYNNRDHFGNLPGGQMNHGMQSRVVNKTIEDVEAERDRAAMQAVAHATFPRYLELNEIELPLYKYRELEDLGKQTLKARCLALRDLIERTGCLFFENHAHLKLNAAQGEDKLLEWYLNVEVTIAAALGMEELDHAAFGAAHLAGSLPPPAVHNQQRKPSQRQMMSQSQYDQAQLQQAQQQQAEQQQAQYEQMAMRRRQQQQQQQMMAMMQEENRPPPSCGQPQKAPPSRGMHDNSGPNASRFDDAARIRAKNNSGSSIFG